MAGSPLAAVEVHRDAVDGPIVTTDNLDIDRRHRRLDEPDLPDLAGGRRTSYFLVFRTVTDGATGNNLFNLNWAEFVGTGVGTP